MSDKDDLSFDLDLGDGPAGRGRSTARPPAKDSYAPPRHRPISAMPGPIEPGGSEVPGLASVPPPPGPVRGAPSATPTTSAPPGASGPPGASTAPNARSGPPGASHPPTGTDPRPTYRPTGPPVRTIAPPAKTPIWRHVVSLVLLGAVVFGIGQCVIQVTDRPEFLSLKYETVGPSPEEARAVVYLLHGYGAPGDDLVSLAKEIAAVGNPDVSFIVVQAPYSHAGGWTWGDSAAEESKAIDRLRKLIGETVGDKPPAAVAVGGFSQGANVSRLVTLADEHIGTALLLSGCRYGPVTPDEPGDVVYFISHGQLDGVCNPSASTILSDELKKRGNPTHFLSFKGGHEIPPEVATAAGEELQKLRAAPSP